MEMKSGATMQYGFSLYLMDGDQKDYLTDELTDVLWKLRSSDGSYYHEFQLVLEDNIWKLHLSPDETETFSPHKSYYYALDAAYPSGDEYRYLEGAMYVRPLGGFDNVR